MKKFITILFTLLATTVFGAKITKPVLIGPQDAEMVTSNDVENLTRAIIDDMVDNGGIFRPKTGPDSKEYKLSIEPVMGDECIFYYANGKYISTNIVGNLTYTDVFYAGFPIECYHDTLVKVIIGYNVTNIATSALKGESFPNLHTVVMHNNIQEINWGAFMGAHNLTSVYVSGINTLEDRDAVSDRKIVLPSGLKKLDRFAFARSGIKGILVVPPGITNVGTSIFVSCSNLTDVIFSDGLENIGRRMFDDCINIKTPVFPSSITNIGDSAFQNCINMTGELVIPGTVKCISSEAFHGCKNLTGLVLNNGITKIDESAFRDCVKIDGHLTIPSSVIDLLAAAFQNTGIESVDIPASINHISDSCFEDCKKLETVTLPSTVKYTIGDSSFCDCTNLYSINFNYITNIDATAFSGCTRLSGKLTIHDELDYIGPRAFMGCTNLQEVVYEPNDSDELYIYGGTFENCTSLTNVIITDNIKGIIDSAFTDCPNLKSVTLPDNIEDIGHSVFQNCSALEDIELPNTITNLGANAFKNCTSLTGTLDLPDNLLVIGDSGFRNCTGLTNVEFPNGLERITGSSFYGCYNLAEPIVIPDSVKLVGGSSFESCSNLPSITIGSGVTNINGYAFAKCIRLKELNFIDTEENPSQLYGINEAAFYLSGITNIVLPNSFRVLEKSAFESCGSLTNIVLNEGIEILGTQAFYNCDKLKDVTVPESVTNIGTRTFAHCNALTNIEVNANNTYYCDVDGVLMDKDEKTLIQYPCGSTVIDYNIPNTVSNIGTYAFSYNSKIERIGFAERDPETSPAEIGIENYAITECSHLKKINSDIDGICLIPDFVTSIGRAPLYRSRLITTINVDANNENFVSDNGVLYQSTAAAGEPKEANILIQYPLGRTDESYTIPATVTELGYYSVSDQDIIKQIVFDNSPGANPVSIRNRSFEECSYLTNVTFNARPIDIIEEYSFAVCSRLPNFEIPLTIPYIPNGMFQQASSLTNIDIPTNIVSVGAYAFNLCIRLTNVSLSTNTLRLNQYAFVNCTALDSIFIPSNITNIGQYAFSGCTKLKSLEIEQRGKTGIDIAQYAFQNCSLLGPTVTIHTNINLGTDAFKGCTSIEELFFPELKIDQIKTLNKYPWGLSPNCIKPGIVDTRNIMLVSRDAKQEDVDDIVNAAILEIIKAGIFSNNGKTYRLIEVK